MQNALGAMTRVFSMCPLPEALERISRCGFHHVGLLGQHQGKRPLREDMTDEDVKRIAHLLQQNGLEAIMAWGGAINSTNLEPTRIKIRRTAELGIPLLLLLGPRAHLARDTASTLPDFQPGECQVFADTLHDLATYADSIGVKLGIKPHGGPTGTAQGLSQLVRNPAAAGVGVFYDPGNILFYMGVRPEADLPIIAPHVTGLCVKDHRGPVGANDFPTPGQGDVDWPAIMSTLKANGFSGPSLIEVISGTDPDHIEQELIKARAYVTELLAEG